MNKRLHGLSFKEKNVKKKFFFSRCEWPPDVRMALPDGWKSGVEVGGEMPHMSAKWNGKTALSHRGKYDKGKRDEMGEMASKFNSSAWGQTN